MHRTLPCSPFVGSALCLGLRVSSLSSNCIGVASGSGTEIGGASTAHLAVLGFGHSGAPSVCSQGLNRAPGSWKSNFGIGSRSEISMNGMTPPLDPFPLEFQPVHEASCRPPSPLPNPGAFASHVGGGGSGDCQLLADIPCNVVGGGPVNPSGERGVDHCCG